jgi:glycosyltransferase involved in cell wall biosynthesis
VRISVALAARDAAQFLDPLLVSLRHQTLLPHELVAYDDASTDSTPVLLERFAASAPFPVRVERGERHAGHVHGFFKAAASCTGDAVAFCDADDVWAPEKLATCAHELVRSEAVLALHATRIVDRDLSDLGRNWPAIGSTRVAAPLGLTGLELIAPGMAMVFRRSLLDALDPGVRPRSRYDADRAMLHDEWTFFIAGVLGPIVLVETPLVFYRQHGSNDSGGWFDERRRTRFKPVRENYRAAAALTREWAEFLSEAASRSDAEADALRAGSAHYMRMAEEWGLRAALYGTGARARRARIVRTLYSREAYRARDEGGFGRAALAKDVAAGVLRRL